MTPAYFNRVAVPQLTAALKVNSAKLAPLLSGVDPMVQRLGKLPDRSKLDLDTLYLIAREKSRRKASLIRNNDNDLVQRVTELAFSLSDGAKAVQLLRVLDGVDVPTASAVLSWMFPDRWPVIDVRAWKTLHTFGVVTSRETGTGLGIAQWRVYLHAVEALLGQLSDLAKSPQQVDRLLYGYDLLNLGDRRP